MIKEILALLGKETEWEELASTKGRMSYYLYGLKTSEQMGHIILSRGRYTGKKKAEFISATEVTNLPERYVELEFKRAGLL